MDLDNFMNVITRPKVMLAIGIALVVIFLAGWGIGTYVDIRNDGRTQELALTKQWKTMVTQYGQFRLGLADKLAIAREKRDAIDKIINDAVTGRYDKAGQDGTVDRQAVFSAIREAYPDLKGLNIFDDVMKDIQAGRERFASEQSQMADQVRGYNTWCTTGSLLHPMFVRWQGFPSKTLEARMGDKTYYGQEALDKMSQVFIDGNTAQIFDTGVDKSLTTK